MVPGQAVVVQPVRVVVPIRDRTIVYKYYRTEFVRRPLPAGPRQEGQWLPAAGPGQEALGRGPAAAAAGRLLPGAAASVVQQLAPVPPGYDYVRVDNDVLLMDMANRMVADVINDLYELD